MQELINQSLAKSTRTTYDTGTHRFLHFCKHHHVQPLPASKATIAYFAAELSNTLTPATVNVYVAAVGSLHRQAGLPNPTSHNPTLNMVKKGLRRAHTAPPSSTPRQPITTQILADMLQAIKQSHKLCSHDRLMLTAAFTLAFFGFLRISEFTTPSKAFNSQLHPSAKNIHWSKNHFTYHLPHSKTDQFFKGHTLYLPRLHNNTKICPYTAMDQYFAKHKHHYDSPLFTFANRQPLTRRSCLYHLRYYLRKAHYQAEMFNTHSFRIGAASSAAQAGLSPRTIKHLGRWRSSAYRRYIRSTHLTELRNLV